MQATNKTWNTLTLLPIAIAIVLSAGLEWVLKPRLAMDLRKTLDRTSKSFPGEERTASGKPELKTQWRVVRENGKRQLRMRWTVATKNGAGQEVA